jgi:hypothetical protein
MNDIKCQAEHAGSGCYTCGGYGVVMVVCSCAKCGKEYLTRPGPHSIDLSTQARAYFASYGEPEDKS